MIDVRPAGIADAQLLSAIRTASFGEEWSKESIARLIGLPGAYACIASAEDEACGACLLTPSGDVAELAFIGVTPPARRRGVANQLLSGAIEAAQDIGYRRLVLEVATDNQPALNLYTSAGFSEVGRRPRYYSRAAGTRVDAVVMQLHLQLDK